MYPRLFEVQGSVYEWQSIKVKGFGFCAMSISDRTACMLCPVRLFVTPWTVAHQAPPSILEKSTNDTASVLALGIQWL